MFPAKLRSAVYYSVGAGWTLLGTSVREFSQICLSNLGNFDFMASLFLISTISLFFSFENHHINYLKNFC